MPAAPLASQFELFGEHCALLRRQVRVNNGKQRPAQSATIQNQRGVGYLLITGD